MFKSVFLGTLWGALVAGLGLVSASIIMPLPEGLRPEQTAAPDAGPPAPLPALAPDDIAPPAPVAAVPEPQAVAPAPEPQSPPEPSPDSVVAVPEGVVAKEEPRADTDPLPEPISGDALANPDAPVENDAAADAMVEAAPPTPPEVVAPEASSDIAPAPAEQAVATPQPAPDPLPETPAPDQTAAALPEPAPPAQETAAAPPEPEVAPAPRLMQPVPRLGASSDPAADPQDMSDLPLEQTTPGMALDRNAEPFENPETRPVLVLLLRDDPDFDGDISALAGSNVTLVIDPDHPQAPGRAQMWRAAGVEVALLATGLPSSAQASDFEVALEVLESSLPQALAFVTDPEGVFQADRARASAAALALAARGYGLVTWEKGLNPADQAARRVDLPATRIFRAIDAEGESVPNIRRALDRAVFKASQDGQVVIWGHLRPETLQALADWSQTARAGQVAPAPLSVVLRGAAP